jgi:hypothetical protein
MMLNIHYDSVRSILDVSMAPSNQQIQTSKHGTEKTIQFKIGPYAGCNLPSIHIFCSGNKTR